jgi:hypothetical protein
MGDNYISSERLGGEVGGVADGRVGGNVGEGIGASEGAGVVCQGVGGRRNALAGSLEGAQAHELLVVLRLCRFDGVV